ncbi:hypothetical protein ABW20_dc0108858 [Dactylellina cionopaga]|nr:hypothetical protein ABW20_dc0108858 [Dactylellina cionopaga]
MPPSTPSPSPLLLLSRHLRHHHPRLQSQSRSLLLLSHPNVSYNGFNNQHPGLTSHRTITTTSTIDTLLETTQSLVLTLQSTTSLPWLFTIPLIAILTRTAITLPFTIYSYKRTNKQISLSPLVSAWSAIYRTQVASERYPASPNTPKELVGTKLYGSPEAWQKEVLARTRRKRVEIYKEFGCQYWKGFVGLVQIPVWFIASITVRRLAGVEGLWVSNNAGKRASAVGGDVTGIDVDTNASDLAVGNTAGSSMDSATVADNGTGGVDEVITVAREQMRNDGVEGWFPDLLQPDPLMILPIMFSLTLFTNVASISLRSNREPTGWRKHLRSALMGISIAVIPMTLNSPSILLLYWITSGSYSLLQNTILAKLMPFGKTVEPVPGKVPSWLKKNTEDDAKGGPSATS